MKFFKPLSTRASSWWFTPKNFLIVYSFYIAPFVCSTFFFVMARKRLYDNDGKHQCRFCEYFNAFRVRFDLAMILPHQSKLPRLPYWTHSPYWRKLQIGFMWHQVSVCNVMLHRTTTTEIIMLEHGAPMASLFAHRTSRTRSSPVLYMNERMFILNFGFGIDRTQISCARTRKRMESCWTTFKRFFCKLVCLVFLQINSQLSCDHRLHFDLLNCRSRCGCHSDPI